jgi:capsular exopolysaccharide synthesis family protein
VTLVAVVASVLQPPAYQGEAKVLITASDAGSAILGSGLSNLTGGNEFSAQTQVQVIQSQQVLERAIATLTVQTTPDALLQKVTVLAVGDTNVITISATDDDPQSAAAIANALAQAYVQSSAETKRASIKAAADEVQTRLDAAKSEIVTLSLQAESSKNAGAAKAELSIATANYASLSQKLEDLRVNQQLVVGNAQVIGVAAPDPIPVSPKSVRNGVLGLVAGLVIGIGIALLRDYMDNTVKTAEEAEGLYGAAVLGNIPAEKLKRGESRRLSITLDPGGSAAEAYRVLRSNLNFVNFEHDIKALLVTSPTPGEGKSTVAANLATALARAGAKVALINADFHRPVTEELLTVTNLVGLSDVLLGSVRLDAALQRPVEGENLLVLNSGKTPPNPSELLGSDTMGSVVTQLREWSDWIIFDSPPLLAASDALALTRWADGVLMVTRSGVSTRQAALAGREMLDKVGARTVGVVVWGLSKASSGGSYGHYVTYGHYGPGTSNGTPNDAPIETGSAE